MRRSTEIIFAAAGWVTLSVLAAFIVIWLVNYIIAVVPGW